MIIKLFKCEFINFLEGFSSFILTNNEKESEANHLEVLFTFNGFEAEYPVKRL